MSLLTGHGATTNNPVLGHTSIAPRVSTSKLIFCTIPGLNPPQRLAHRHELGATGAGRLGGFLFCLANPVTICVYDIARRTNDGVGLSRTCTNDGTCKYPSSPR